MRDLREEEAVRKAVDAAYMRWPRTDEAWSLLDELRAAGVDVRTLKCDVSSPESLEAALDECSDMPPIKGCLQATMVLQVSKLENTPFPLC